MASPVRGTSDSSISTEAVNAKEAMPSTADENLAASALSESNDPYLYTKMAEFTSEIFKIEIGGLPRRFGFGQLKSLLNKKLNLNAHKVKSLGPRSSWAFVTFRCEDDRSKALQVLNGYKWNGRVLTVKRANPAADPLVKKRRRRNESAEGESSSKIAKDTNDDQDLDHNIKIKDAVMPLWNMPYEEQLKTKESALRKYLIKLGRQIEKNYSATKKLPQWLHQQQNDNDNMCCPMESIRPSPIIDGYRNKCEFTVAMDANGCKKTVGFRLTKYSAGSMCVAEASDCNQIVPDNILSICKVFQDYVQQSDKDPYNPEKHSGYWRQLTVRSNRNGETLVIVVMHPQSLTEEQIRTVKEDTRSYLIDGPGKSCGIVALYFQLVAKRGEESPLENIYGTTHICETILGLQFRISPDAFFQVNSAAAEVLYNSIEEVAGVKTSNVLLDICCGTGTIGLTLAKKVKSVIGIEMVANAVEDARHNASLNSLSNVDFICGKVEDVLQSTLHHQLAANDEVIAIVDPPRNGLHNKVIRAIRGCQLIKRLIYVSCNPEAAVLNFINLCKAESNQYSGEPFTIVKALPVDLFPHSNHCELILCLERRKP